MSHSHHGYHHHHHPPAPNTDATPFEYAEANRQHFDKVAEEYDAKEYALPVSRQAAESMLKAYHFDPAATTVMDYACGTGLISRFLVPHAKSIVGVDISQGMVDYYNNWAKTNSIPLETMRAVRHELKGEPEELDGLKFDVIVCAHAYHHFGSITDTTRVFVTFLKPKGTLIVVDLIQSLYTTDVIGQGLAAEQQHMVPHKHGFGEEEMRSTFEGAGLVDFTFRAGAVDVAMGDKHFKSFIALGVKASALH